MPDTSPTTPATESAAKTVTGPDALRPERLADFGGQPDIARELGIVLRAARSDGRLPDHILFAGPPGLGKTTLSHIVANELGLDFVTTSGPALDKPAGLITILTALQGPTVLFIDEIHRLPIQVEETLYPAMEDGVLDIVIGEGDRARPIRLPLKPFLLVGATTQTGLLSAPMRDRFGFTAKLALYDTDALADIVERSAHLLGLDITADGAHEIAGRSRGTPRIANNWLRRVRDYIVDADLTDEPVDADIAADALAAFGVDAVGLDRAGREILDAIVTTFGGGPVGLNTLAATVGEAPTTVEDVYEPFLLRRGFINRTPQGRVATLAAFEHLGVAAPARVLARAGLDDTPARPEQPGFAFDQPS